MILPNKPTQANRTLGVISKMMNLAGAWGLRPERSDPCYHVRKYKETRRERFLTTEELARMRKALDGEESFAPAAVTAFRLLLYTGARLSEIQTLKWEHIRGDRIHLPDKKTGCAGITTSPPPSDAPRCTSIFMRSWKISTTSSVSGPSRRIRDMRTFAIENEP